MTERPHGDLPERSDRPDGAAGTAVPWLPVVLGVVCALAIVALLFGVTYLKAHGG